MTKERTELGKNHTIFKFKDVLQVKINHIRHSIYNVSTKINGIIFGLMIQTNQITSNNFK